MNDLERAYRVVEQRREVSLETRVFRGKVGVLLALQLSLLLAAITFAVDLRRLSTPQGVTQAWAEAYVFGDCDRARRLSTGAPLDCAEVARRAEARAGEIGAVRVVTRLAAEQGDRASVALTVTDADGSDDAVLALLREDGAWKVLQAS